MLPILGMLFAFFIAITAQDNYRKFLLKNYYNAGTYPFQTRVAQQYNAQTIRENKRLRGSYFRAF